MDVTTLIDAVAQIKSQADELTHQEIIDSLSRPLAEFTTSAENQGFAEAYGPSGNYTRLLLNDPREPYQIVLVFWGPGRGSPIHDHDDTIGAVSALTGEAKEIKYGVTRCEGERVKLTQGSEFTIAPGRVTPILPEADKQLHLMVNEETRWAATVHIYLTAIHRYRQYEPTPDGAFRTAETSLWFDECRVGRRMPTRTRI
ncbi:cysteine dioxygenase [Streptomyces rugosispiralis]|uniref:Cysteine dioxygenase family protein n=1 Tax=Streptomyces rugosispiralis TaxID=2967341 RepID=A0ABT1V8M9_9ACTN|nr:cysteine dioxygenase family protein [Streptomyces rugosispiralis]MCQ8193764.1 cysteine dioxygenase family protein [Streptomyces rugosispiralis]